MSVITTERSDDSIKELERALLDHQMEAFQPEIRSRLASFNKHKEHLLSLLHDAIQRGTKVNPFNKQQSWLRIETTAYEYFAQEILTYNVWSGADHEARYRAIAEALRDARNKMEELRYPDIAGHSTRGWLERTQGLVDTTKQFRNLLYLECEFDKLIQILSRLERKARQVAAATHKGPGRPKGGSALPWNHICELADDFRKSTGRKPGRGGGPFSRFVKGFFKAVGVTNITSGTLTYVIRDAHTHWLKIRGRPSPFD